MKKKIFLLFIAIFLFMLMPFGVHAKDKIKLYFFYGDGCPHCAEENEKLISKIEKYDDVEIIKLETWYNEKNHDLLIKVSEKLGLQPLIPFTMVGDVYTVGYTSSVDEIINQAIQYYRINDIVDNIEKIKNDEEISLNPEIYEIIQNQDRIINAPLVGEINVSEVSIGMAAVIIGLVDGFNPCAMWILIFLLTTLINMKDRKRLVLLGLIFIMTSAFTYFLIMFGWLHIVVKVTASTIVRYAIGLFALGAGLYNLYSFYKSLKNDGCTVVSKKKRKSVITHIKKYAFDKRLLIAILGIVVLAISVNIIELLCSAGLPLVFSELLAMNNITGVGAVFYDLLYILFFMLDDLIVFFIAVKTMNIVGVSNKFGKYSHLIAGIIMVIIGLLLMFNPGILMFNF